MRLRSVLAGALAAGLSITSAYADDVYFHRAGATWSEYEADVNYCVARTANTTGSVGTGASMASSILVGGALGAVMAIAQEAAERPKQRRRNVSYCMAMRGWTTVQIENLVGPENEGDDANRYLDQRIQTWFAEPSPPNGEVILRPEVIERTELEPPAVITRQVARAEARRRRP